MLGSGVNRTWTWKSTFRAKLSRSGIKLSSGAVVISGLSWGCGICSGLSYSCQQALVPCCLIFGWRPPSTPQELISLVSLQMRSHNIGFLFYLFSHPEILMYIKFFCHVTKPISNHHFFLKALDTICQVKNAEFFWANHLKYYGKTHFIFFDLCTKTSLTVGCWLLWFITIKKGKDLCFYLTAEILLAI